MKPVTSCLATLTKATLPTPTAHHGTSGRWKPRPFPCCAVNPLACQEQSTAVVTSNHGARARHSPSVPPNASSAPPTKSYAQAIPASDTHIKRRRANPRLARRVLVTGLVIELPNAPM